jgi:hypothetical protein
MKTTPIEKFQYLVHLKATNVHLFYRLLSENIKVRSGIKTRQEQVADINIGIDPSHLYPDRRRSLRAMARDLDTTGGHVPLME